MITNASLLHIGSIIGLMVAHQVVPNDDCENAMAIMGQGIFPFDNTNATTDGPPSYRCNDIGQAGPDAPHDVWFCWTPTFSDVVSIDTCGRTTVDTKVVVYEGCGCGQDLDRRDVACSDDECATQSRAVFWPDAGLQYLIRIGTADDDVLTGGRGTFAIDYGDPFQSPGFSPLCDVSPDACQTDDRWHVYTSDRQHRVVADNFVPAVTGEITNVCWWGTYLHDLGDWKDLSLDTFEIRYYENDGGVPGSLIAGPFVQLLGDLDVNGPNLEFSLLADGQRDYAFSGQHNPVPVTAGECYWLEITNDSYFLSQWQWAASVRGDHRAFQDGRLGDSPDGYDTLDAVVSDMAFCLDIPLMETEACHAPPANDFCQRGEPVREGLTDFDTTGATIDGPPVPLAVVSPLPSCAFPLGDDQIHGDVWFDFTAPCAGMLTLDLCESRFDTKIAVYGASDCTALGNPLACNDDACGAAPGHQSHLNVELDHGGSYKIRVGGYFGATGPGTFELTFRIQPPSTVDLSDYALFASCYTVSCSEVPCDPVIYPNECCWTQDFDADGDVDADDLPGLVAVWQGPIPSQADPAAGAVAIAGDRPSTSRPTIPQYSQADVHAALPIPK